MAVQQNKSTRSTRGMRRSHHALYPNIIISTDRVSGEIHRRHYVTFSGFYRGRRMIEK